MSANIYPFNVKNIEGDEVSLQTYEGKVLLIVNTASECGFTPQFSLLESIYRTYKDQGFEILAFPSDDFGHQEPLEGSEIAQFCETHYRVTFPIFEKVHVKGRSAAPLFQFLSKKELNGRIGTAPQWNFHKYLIDRKGKVVDYFMPFTKPDASKVKQRIEFCLKG